MKDIKDYLHLYLGCECMIGDLSWRPETNLYGLAPGVDVNYGRPIKSTIDAHVLTAFAHKTTPILRQLSSMTEEEKKVYWNIGMDPGIEEQFRWVLSKGFDLFGLIEAGLAIDKTTLKS